MEKKEHKISRAVAWFNTLSEEQKSKVVELLFDFVIESEWIGVWPEEDIPWLAKESEGRHTEEHYRIPYLRSCGEPIL